jgi:hypothetical protein
VKLKPCPFCGGDAGIKDIETRDQVFVTKSTIGCYTPECGVNISADTTFDAFILWNQRQQPKKKNSSDAGYQK